MPPLKELTCNGINYAVSLHPEGIRIENTRSITPRKHELPLKRITSVIVERKRMLPFATLTAISAIVAVVAKYNPLWFIVSFPADRTTAVSTIALFASGIFAIPTMSRALFVNVVISWDGRPRSFVVRFVLAGHGRRLARRFHRLSAGS